ncbi:flocculation protein FLO11 [Diaphorina citri]|uniref:Flocculation protein FLO11 n=1 Tax=Diaphorina citri TaxID=121845 RepID=A0A1S4EDV2_DIACI|nr:flocculation protein FLO11 [Diaphorina citri]
MRYPEDLQNDPVQIKELRQLPSFSPVFNIVLQPNIPTDLSARPNNRPLSNSDPLAKSSRLASLNQQVSNYLQKISSDIEEKIRQFSEEQYSILEKERTKVQTEHRSLMKVVNDTDNISNNDSPLVFTPYQIKSPLNGANNVKSIGKSQDSLITVHNIGSWVLHKCLNCKLDVYASRKQDIVISSDLLIVPPKSFQPKDNEVQASNTVGVNAIPRYKIFPTTVDIPKRVVAPSNNNVNVVKPDESETSVQYTTPSTTTPYPSTTTTTVAPKEGYDYPKPSIPFPVPEQEGYDYPKPSIPFSDGISFPSISGAPLSSFNAPAPIFGSSVTLDSRFSNGINYPKPSIPFSDGISFPSISGAPLSSFNAPAPIFGSSVTLDSRFSNGIDQFPFGFSPLASFSDSVQYQPLVPSPAPIVTSTTVAPELFFKSNSEFVSSPQVSYSYQPLQQSVSTISPFSAPAVTYSDQTFTTVSPYTLSTPAPPTVSYTSSQPAFSQSLSTLAPLLLSKESLALSSSTPQPPSSQITTTESPIDKSSQVSTEKPTVTSTSSSTPLSGSYNSQLFGQYFNSLPSTSYSFPSFDSSLSSVSPVSYNFDNSLTRFNSFNYQPLPGVSYSSISPLPVQSYSSFAPLSGESYSTASPLFGQSYSSVSPLSGLSYSSGESYSTTVSPLFGQSYSSISPLSGQSYTTSSPLSVQSTSTVSPTESTNEVSSEKSTVTTTPASPAAGSFASQPFGQYFNPPSFSYNFQPIEQSVTTTSPLSYTFEQSSGLRTNYSSFNYQPLSGQYFASQQPPVSYSFQPLGSSFVSGQSYNFEQTTPVSITNLCPVNISPLSSHPSGVSQSDSPSVSYTPSTPAPFNFQSPSQFDGSLFGQNSLTNTPPASQNSQSLSSSGGAQFGHGSFSGSKSALSFSSNIQSVENLQDLQATSKESSDGFDLRQGNNQFAAPVA